MDDDILSEAEVVSLTKKVKHKAQKRVLDAMEIKCTPRPDGSLIVLRKHRNLALGLRDTARAVEQFAVPNFAALDS